MTVVGAFSYISAQMHYCIFFCRVCVCMNDSEITKKKKYYKWILTHCMHEIDAGGLNCGFYKFHQIIEKKKKETSRTNKKLRN